MHVSMTTQARAASWGMTVHILIRVTSKTRAQSPSTWGWFIVKRLQHETSFRSSALLHFFII